MRREQNRLVQIAKATTLVIALAAQSLLPSGQLLMLSCAAAEPKPANQTSVNTNATPDKDLSKDSGKNNGKDSGDDAPSVPIASMMTVVPGTSQPANPDMTVESIKIEGNRLVPTEDILGVVKTKPGDKFDRDRVLGDLKAINGMGYFDDRSLQVVPEQTSTGSGILLKIRVTENEPVTQFSFQGNEVLSTDDISKIFADQLGKPQNLNQLSAAIDKVEQSYHAKGFLLARVVDVKDDPDGSINLSINEGTIDKIEIVGNHKTKDFIIRNAIKVKTGQVYNERLLTADLRKLYNEGYFQDIRRSLVPSPTDPDKYTLKVEVDEKRTGSVGMGGGIDAMSGPFGSLNFSDGNFQGKGQVLSFNGQVGLGGMSGLTSRLSNGGQNYMTNSHTFQTEATWIEPHLNGTNTSMAVSAFGRDINSSLVQYALQRTYGSSVTFSHPLGNHMSASLGLTADNTEMSNSSNLLQNQTTGNYLANRVEQMGMATTVNQAITEAANIRQSQLKGGVYASINPSVQYDTRNNVMDPTSGTYIKATGSPTLGITSGSYLRAGVSASQYFPVSETSNIALNVQGGSSIGSMPAFAQYRLGGLNGIRGYRSFTDLGTGTSMLMATAEYRYKLPFIPKGDPKSLGGKAVNMVNKHVKGAFFLDAGGVGGNPLVNNVYQQGMFGASIGVGLRINLPMLGVVRLDYGMPLVASPLGGFTPRFTVGFGNKF